MGEAEKIEIRSLHVRRHYDKAREMKVEADAASEVTQENGTEPRNTQTSE